MAISSPGDIPGLVAWYSAEAETAYADGAQMTQWTDLSGNGNHASGNTADTTQYAGKPFWQAATGPSGGPAVRFGAFTGSSGLGAGGYFSLPTLLAGAAAGEVMATVKSDYNSSTSQGTWIAAGSSAAGSYPYLSTIYDGFGSTTRKTVGSTGTTSITVWRRVNAWSAASDYAWRVDGGNQYSTTSNTVGWRAQPMLGNSGATGPSSAAGATFEGHLGCVVLYSRKLTTTERADLDVWLAANPSGGIATGSPNVFIATALAGAAGVSGVLGLHPASLGATLAPQAILAVGLRQTADAAAAVAADSTLSAALTIQGRVDLAASFAATASLAAAAQVLHVTDTATPYANDGYTYGGGVSEVTYDPPIAATPAGIRRAKIMRVHQSIPAPTLADGRPV